MSWQSALQQALCQTEKLAILGVGSILCGDDAAGMLLIEQLEEKLGPNDHTLLLGGSTAPENFTGVIRSFGPDTLLLVDAAQINGAIGEIALLAVEEIAGTEFSTHMLPLPVMLAYLQAHTGCQIIVAAIQPGEMSFATEPCKAVLAAVEELASLIASLR